MDVELDPLQRLADMRKTTRMWAVTREGFAQQVLIMLELLGFDGREMFSTRWVRSEGDAEQRLTIAWAEGVIDDAMRLVTKGYP